MRPLLEWWGRFVTADGAAYTAGRLALALVVSVLFFPFGAILIVLIWSLAIKSEPVVIGGHFGGNLEVPANHSRKAWWFLALSVVLPTAFGAIVHFLPYSQVHSLGTLGLFLADLSLFPSSLQEWFDGYSRSSSPKGPQFIISALAIGLLPPIVGAQLMRHLDHVPNNYAGLFLRNEKSSTLVGLLFLFLLGSIGAPLLFVGLSPQLTHDAGLAGPGAMLTAFPFPIVIGPVVGILIGAFALWTLLTILRAKSNTKHKRR